MVLNYYFLQHLSRRLSQLLQGKELVCCFTQSKDELVLGFVDDTKDEFYLRVLLSSQLTLLSFPKDYHRAKKNSVNLFMSAIGSQVVDVIQYKNERCFALLLSSGSKLLFKMHGNRSNILLIDENRQVKELFNKRLQKDLLLVEDKLHRELDQDFNAFQASNGDLKALFPTFGKRINAYIKGLELEQLPREEQWEKLSDVLTELNSEDFYIAYEDEQPYISLLKGVQNIEETYDDPIEVLNRYYYLLTREYFLSLEKNKLLKSIEHKIKKSTKYLEKTKSKLQELLNNRSEEELANIVMANLHQIQPKATSVDLHDFYQNNTITIKLKASLSPQKNAELLYRKAKNKSIEIDVLKKNISNKESEIGFLSEERNKVADSESVKNLRKLNKEEERKDNTSLKPYIEFNYMGFAIYVGRNAKHNDTLTLKVARKDDLWLHAKDVAGSHVVIKTIPGQGFPDAVIEAAAQLAAHYSKRKSDSLCPVIYTPKKYVRKVKGSKPGAVMVDKEKVVIVKPQKIL